MNPLPENESNSQQQSSSLSSPLSTSQLPVLELQSVITSAREDTLISEIDAAICRLLSSPNHQSPYWYAFEWGNQEDSKLRYSVRLTIHEPS